MIDLAPEIVYTPPLYHRHEWRLFVFRDVDEWDVCARCLDCPDTMTREQVEAILNGARMLTDAN